VGRGERERWNARYGSSPSPAAGVEEPSRFLASLEALLPRRGRALDVAGGSGRNALWLARRGLDVTLADVSDVALSIAARAAREEGLSLATVEVDLELGPPPAGPWDVVVCTYFLHRPLLAALPAALAPGGWLAVAHATRRNLEKHPRPPAQYLLAEGELRALAAGLELVRYEEGWLEEGRHEARLVARRAAVAGRGEGESDATPDP
jgi:SAM-dependent methyltransferase